MIRGVLFAVCAAALMGCAMESGEDETATTADESADPASMNMDRGYVRPTLNVADYDRCGSPRHKIVHPSDLPTNLTHVPTPAQTMTNTR